MQMCLAVHLGAINYVIPLILTVRATLFTELHCNFNPAIIHLFGHLRARQAVNTTYMTYYHLDTNNISIRTILALASSFLVSTNS